MPNDNSPLVAEFLDSQTASTDSSDSEPPPKKRVCLEDSNVATDQPLVPPTTITLPLSHLQRLPLELLAEILEYTRSPKDVLSVARTCKSLCATLISPSSNFIWKTVRRESVVPVPDPIEIFSEVSYASFLFDSGKCEMCGKETELPYTSFSLRFRLCKEHTCHARFISERVIQVTNNEVDPVVKQWTPLLEAIQSIFPQLQNHVWPAIPGYCLRDVWNKATEEYRAGYRSPDYIIGKQPAIKRNDSWMNFCVELHKWKTARGARQLQIKKKNQHLLEAFSEKNGWNYDVIKLKEYGSWHKHKCNILELITLDDLRTREKDIEEELLAFQDKQRLRARASGQQRNWQSIKTYWERLRSSPDISGLPSLSTFRTLPAVSLIQDTEAPVSLPSDRAIKSVIEEQIKRWTGDAITEFDKMLGFENWRTANSRLVHPCRRFSSKFQCKLCRTLTDKYSMDRCFDFDGVCVHDCPRPKHNSNRNWKPPVWKPDNFEVDQRASAAAKMLLQLLHFSDETHVSSKELTGWIICESCKPATILHARSVVGHSHRHLAGEYVIRIASPEECTRLFGGHQHVDFGTALKLLQPSNRARRVREEKKFGCWICSRSRGGWVTTTEKDGAQNEETLTIASDNTDVNQVPKNASRKKPMLFIWNGIRSHLKEKHGIEQIRDEDFYTVALKP